MPPRGDGSIVKLILAAVGVFFLGLGGWMVYTETAPHVAQAAATRAWRPVEGRLLSVTLEKRHGRGGTRGATAAIVTHEVKATYAYAWDGVAFEGARVGVAEGADNIGAWQTETYARLRAAHRAGRPVAAWVDPRRPERAVLDRDPRLGLLALKAALGLALTLVGLLLAAVPFLSSRRPEKTP